MGLNQSVVSDIVVRDFETQFNSKSNNNFKCNSQNKIDNITLKNGGNCNITVSNSCKSTLNNEKDMIIESIMKSVSEMNTKQKAEFMGGLNMDVKMASSKETFKVKFEDLCENATDITNSNIIKNVDIDGGCNHFLVDNIGDAVSTCMLRTALKTADDINKKTGTDQDAKGVLSGILDSLGTAFEGNYALVIGCVCVCCILIIVVVVALYFRSGGSIPNRSGKLPMSTQDFAASMPTNMSSTGTLSPTPSAAELAQLMANLTLTKK